MSVDVLHARQVSVLLSLLHGTQRAEFHWDATSDGAFRAERNQTSVILERLDAPPQIELHFVATDNDAATEVIRQTAAKVAPGSDEDRINKLLTKTWLYLRSHVGRGDRPSPTDSFLKR